MTILTALPRVAALAWPCAMLAPVALAQAVPPAPTEQITVVGASPLLGSGIDRNLVPAATQVLGSADIARDGAPDLLQALDSQVAGLNLDSASGNQYQPSLFYNGFEASPLQGTSQGVAVYVNGIRFNQPFGDTVNWDLIPDIALRSINVEGSNPVFGLNALGGAINAALKDGFSSPGGQADLSGGSFGQIQADAQYGLRRGDQALYVAGSEQHQQGWRDMQSSDIQNAYGDWGIRRNGHELHIDLDVANSSLNGPGTAPVQLLAADPRAQFTAPNLVDNRFLQAAIRGNWDLGQTLSLQTQAYYSYFLQKVRNGNTANDAPCGDGSGLLCQSPGVVSTTRGGAPIPDFLSGGPYNELDAQTTNTNGFGAAAQLTETGGLFGLANHLVAGAAFDGAQTEFSATAFLGGLTPITRAYFGPGVVIDEPGNTVPVRVAIADQSLGAYGADTLNVTPAIAVTLSGRFNFAEVDLRDQNGGDLTGNHAFARFNPAMGATWRLAPWLTAYAGYAEANRAPTPAELSCAGPQNACSLANFFVGDPDLKQVVAHTVEAGLRGTTHGIAGGRLSYQLGLFRAESDNDIVFINSVTLNRAYFSNIGRTQRQGVSAHADFRRGGVTAYLDYSYTAATFQTGFTESAGSNPQADANGNITVRPGDRLPGVPGSIVKTGLDLAVSPALTLGADGQLQSGQYLFGDEANLTPRLPGFVVLNLHGSYDITPHIQVFAAVKNVLDRHYYTLGTFSPTGSVFLVQAPNATNPRSYSLAAPVGAFGGVRVTF